MLYPLIPIGLILVFVGYILYLVVKKKDIKGQMKTVILPGLMFVGVWVAIYLVFFLKR